MATPRNDPPPRFSQISFKALVERVDPTRRHHQQPVTYYFSGGRTKREPRVPFYGR